MPLHLSKINFIKNIIKVLLYFNVQSHSPKGFSLNYEQFDDFQSDNRYDNLFYFLVLIVLQLLTVR